jgi:hypothetical protein
MRHTTVIAAIAIAQWITGGPAIGQTKKQTTPPSAPANTKNTYPQNEQRASEPFIIQIENSPHAQTGADAAHQTAQQKDFYDKLGVWCGAAVAIFTLALVVVGACGVNAAVRTLKEIAIQGRHIINSERAWITISIVHPPNLRPIGPGAIPPYNEFLFDITNDGKTVARLMEVATGHRVLPNGENLPDKPDYINPNPNDSPSVYGKVVVPGRPIEKISFGIKEVFSNERFDKILNGDLVLWVYGFIKYFDFANVERKAQFCYRYVFTGIRFTKESSGDIQAQWMVAGPRDYNSHT